MILTNNLLSHLWDTAYVMIFLTEMITVVEKTFARIRKVEKEMNKLQRTKFWYKIIPQCPTGLPDTGKVWEKL